MSKNSRQGNSRLPVMLLEKPSSPSLKSRRTKPKPWWLRRWGYFYKRLLRLRGKPKAIARGFFYWCFCWMLSPSWFTNHDWGFACSITAGK